MVPPPNNRNDVVQRRRRLRELDIALCEELDAAGSLAFQSLRDEVIDRALLFGTVSDESLWEWWHYATRRRIIEPGAHAEEMSLSDRGQTRLEEAQRDALSPSAPKARAAMRYLIPPGLTGAVVAVGLLSKHEVAALVTLGVIAIALLSWIEAVAIDWVWAKWADPRARAAVLKRTVAWLDGDELRLLGRTQYAAMEKSAIRRLPTPAMPELAPSPRTQAARPISAAAHVPSPSQPAAAGSPSSTSLSSSTD